MQKKARPAPTLKFIQKSAEACAREIEGLWIAAVESPASWKMTRKPVPAVAMPTKPKSRGERSRARIIMDPMRKAKLETCPTMEAKAPRVVRPLKSTWSASMWSASVCFGSSGEEAIISPLVLPRRLLRCIDRLRGRLADHILE